MSVTTHMLGIFVPKFGSLEDVDIKSLYFKASALPKKVTLNCIFGRQKSYILNAHLVGLMAFRKFDLKSEMRLEFT